MRQHYPEIIEHASNGPLPSATAPSGLYRQYKLLLRSESVESLESIRRDFSLRKPRSGKSLTVGELIETAVRFMVRHADFDALASAEDLDWYVPAQVYGRILAKLASEG